jgi:hypothetical protein
MKVSRAGRYGGLTLLIICLVASALRASTITISLADVQAPRGQPVEVPVSIRGAQKLGALQADLIYDPAILEPQDLKVGSVSENITIGSNVLEPGRFRVVMNTSASESVTGDGILMVAVFEVKTHEGGTCGLELDRVRAWDNTAPEATPREMLVTLESGSFTVTTIAPTLVDRFSLLALLAIVAVVLVLLVFGLLIVMLLRKAGRKNEVKLACPHCGQEVQAGAMFCGACGGSLDPQNVG